MLLFIGQNHRGEGSSAGEYCCIDCGASLAAAADQISVLDRPPKRTYVNPHGIDCTIVTLAACRGVRPSIFRSTENTWFEGYAWRPLSCQSCAGFLGWRFEADEEDPGGPRRFFGLLVDRLQVV